MSWDGAKYRTLIWNDLCPYVFRLFYHVIISVDFGAGKLHTLPVLQAVLLFT
jgi:hypothetical protein